MKLKNTGGAENAWKLAKAAQKSIKTELEEARKQKQAYKILDIGQHASFLTFFAFTVANLAKK